MKKLSKKLICAALLLLPLTLRAEEPGLEMILIPLDYGDYFPGAYGSRWSPELWVSAHGGEDLLPFVCYAFGCQPVAGFIGPLEPRLDPFRASGEEPGLVWFVRSEEADRFHFDLRLYELTEQSVRQGIHVPVLRESEFYDGPLELLNVPLDSGKRVALRIYNPDAAGSDATRMQEPRRVRLEIMSHQVAKASTTLVEQELSIPVPRDIELYRDPGVLQFLSLAEDFPALAGVDAVRIRVTPLDEDLRIWAMASVTDNQTQYVSIISPE